MASFAALRWGRAALVFGGLVAASSVGEAALQVLFRMRNGEWAWRQAAVAAEPLELFEYHAFLGGAPRPGAVHRFRGGVTVSIRADGTRSLGPADSVSQPDGRDVVCIGGSTTFCVGVSDEESWPALLQRCLAKRARVTNRGVPGYSTAEAVVQTSLLVPERPGVVCVYYEGLNDARNMNIPGLASDYSDFHGRAQLENLQVVPPAEGSAPFLLVRAGCGVLTQMGLRTDPYAMFRPRRPPDESPVDRIDPDAIAIYRRNLRTLIALCRSRGAEPVFVPQVLDWSRLTGSASWGWAPRVRDSFQHAAMDAYNAAMLDECRAGDVLYVADVAEYAWGRGDFVDQSHFSRDGCARFAGLVAPAVSAALERRR